MITFTAIIKYTGPGTPNRELSEVIEGLCGHRLRQWVCAKRKVQGQGTSRFPDEYLHQQLGLIQLPSLTRNLPWAKA